MRVLILGGSRYYLKAIEAAKELGAEVHVTDRDPQAPAKAVADAFYPVDITDRDGVLDISRRAGIHGIVALNDYAVPTAAHVAEAMGLPGIPPAVAGRAVSKSAMRRRWDEQGVPSARFRRTRSLDQALEAAGELGWPVVLKPSWSMGGASRGVSIVNTPGEMPRAWDFAASYHPEEGVLVEECLVGSEHSAETITWQGETHVLAIGDKVKTPAPYRVDKSVIYPTLLQGEDHAKACDVVARAVAALGIESGAAHVEFCFTDTGPKLFEIGARCGGGGTPAPIIPHVTGINMFKEVVRLSIGLEPEQTIPSESRGCTYHFLTPSPGRLLSINGVETAKALDGILDCEVLVRPGEEIPPVRIGTDRAGFIIAGGPTRESAHTLALRAEQLIDFAYDNAPQGDGHA